jgi:hypothetical protein
MAQHMCDLCGVRPATVRVAVVQDRQRKQINVCDYHYAQLTRHQRQVSPLESLFRGGLFDNFFTGPISAGHPPMGTMPSGAVSEPDGVNLQQHFSDQSKEILQRAAERTVQFGRREHSSTSRSDAARFPEWVMTPVHSAYSSSLRRPAVMRTRIRGGRSSLVREWPQLTKPCPIASRRAVSFLPC